MFEDINLSDREKLLIGVVIVLIIILLVTNSSSFDPTGVWTADGSFLEEAGLTNLTLFIGDYEGGTYPGYLFMSNDDGVIEDQKVNINISNGIGGRSITINGANSWDTMSLTVSKGYIMTFHDGETVFAELYRDNLLSDYSKTAEADDFDD